MRATIADWVSFAAIVRYAQPARWALRFVAGTLGIAFAV